MGYKKLIPIHRNYSIKEQKSTLTQLERDKLMKEFLAKGGKIQKLPPKKPKK